jgi:hypothetical protein
MCIGRREEKEEREARTTTDEGMHPEAPQERTRMVSRSVPISGIRITASPGQDRSTVNDEIPCSDEPSPDCLQNGKHEK